MFEPSLACAAATTGFALGAGWMLSIGPQNLKLIQVGASRRNAATVGVTGYLSEIVIVTAGVCGIGATLQSMPLLKLVLQVAGVAFLLWCALQMFGTGPRNSKWRRSSDAAETRMQAMTSMLVVTWLNPLIYIESMLLVGVLSAKYDGINHLCFALGFLAAAGLRFCGLIAIGRLLAPRSPDGRGGSAFSYLAGSLLVLVAASQAISIG